MSETTAAESAYSRLFSPLEVGPMKLRNRIAETTNTIGAGAMPGFVDDGYIAHHTSKARGGTAWIGGETFLLNSPMPNEAADEFMPGVGSFRIPIYMMPGFVENLGRFCDAVHQTGSVVVCQLTYLNFTLAASAVPLAEVYDWIPHEMDAREIQHCIDTYAAAAAKFMEAGVDGIELHCAHETTPHGFLSPATNKRTDEWGGDALGRTKFVREALLATKARIGDGMALGVRVNGCESREGGYDVEEFRAMMRCIGETGTLDFVNVDVGHSWGSPAYVQPSYYGSAEHREIGKALKQDLDGVAILYAGRVNSPEVGEEMIAGGFADVVGMTRAGIADPEFANKAMTGRVSEIRRCIGCNRCIGQSIRNDAPDAFKKPVCSVNPEIGNELLFAMTNKPAETKRRFVVAGGGPAGLEAARVAAMRGHDVVLVDQGTRLGGALNLVSRTPGRESYADFITFQEAELARLGVDVRLETEASRDSLLALEPDAVACATGALPRQPDTPGADGPRVFQGRHVLGGRVDLDALGERIAVVSQEDHYETGSTAAFLAAAGKRVEIFHKWTHIAAQVDRYSIGPHLAALYERDVVIHTGLRLAAIEGDTLDFTSAFGGRRQSFSDFDSVVLVYGGVPNTSLYHQLEHEFEASTDVAPRLFLVGNAWVPRLIAEATLHGAKVGMEI
jgi:2,4-dienoyl-CoA reductase-like NADH-dependent reductase (Old Yellow Enzyme family)/thioredoxin reductase